jgi:hypothetical protein
MNGTYWLSMIISGMALLLVPAQAPRSSVERIVVHGVRQEQAPAVRVDRDRDDMDLDDVDAENDERDMDMDVPDSDMDRDPDRDEAQMDADADQEADREDADREDADRNEPEMNSESDQEGIDIDNDEASFREHAEEKIEKSFAMPSGAGRRTLEIDNVWGSIVVVGTASDQAKVTVNKSIRAESKTKIEQARKEVTLDVTDQANALKLYVNGPFRCDCHDCARSRDDDGYRVKMDFQVQVPKDIDIRIKTVNEGHVSVRDINGSFVVRNVNGDIQIRNVAGSGTARTVNGPVKVSFRQNPREASDFETVNGAVELAFARDLSADFRFKTFNGGIYSDFPVTALPVQGMQEEHHGAKVIFRADRYTGARINAGGPQIKVENLNGDIRILENHE